MSELVRTALTGLSAHRLRTALTVLGLMIGVGSVIVLIAVGTGSSVKVQHNIQALGSNVLLVTAAPTFGGLRAGAGAGASLTVADAQALRNRFSAPDVKSSSPVINAADVAITYGSGSITPASFIGTTPSYQAARNYSIQAGSWFTAAQEREHSRVLVLGPAIASELFGGADPVGQTVQVNGTDFQVIGVTSPKGESGGVDEDDVAFAPLTAVQDTLTGYGPISQIVVQARSEVALGAAQTEISDILDRLLPPAPGSSTPSFQVVNEGQILRAASSTDSVFTTLLAEVAAISLLVGGIGVMNIMLVSVTERTREIGIRKAIGARRGDILAQFLVEAVLVSVLGGVAGVVGGVSPASFRSPACNR